MNTNSAEVLIQCLEHAGVEVIFGIPGGPLTPFYEALSRSTQIRVVLAKHEQGAAFMANGYARASGKLGVCCVTSGPGGTNALTAIAASLSDSVPVLVISAQVATRVFGGGAAQDGSPLGIDLVQMYKPATKFSGMLAHPARMQDLAQRAIRIALTGRPGPVHLSLPADLAKQPSTYHPPQPGTAYHNESHAVDTHAVEQAMKLLLKAKHPCILVGTGTFSPETAKKLIAFATRTGIPVATSPKAKGMFPEDHPLSLGVLGLSGHTYAETYFNSPALDALLVIGSSLGETVTYNWRDGWSAPLIHVDIDPQEIGKNYPVTIGICSDASAFLTVAQNVVEKSFTAHRPLDSQELHRLKASTPRWDPEPANAIASRPILPQQVIRQLQASLPSDALLFVDIGNCMMWAGHFFEVRTPATYFVNLGLGSMGHATAAAIGAQVAATGRRVFVLAGDAAFAMTGMEVHTATENRLPVTWIVMNNSGHGMVHQGEKVLLGKVVSSCVFEHTLDFAMLGKSLGASGFTVDSTTQLQQAIEASLRSDCPSVIDVRIDRNEIPSALTQRADALKKSFAQAKGGETAAAPSVKKMPGLPS